MEVNHLKGHHPMHSFDSGTLEGLTPAIDIAIISLASQDSQAATLPLATTEDASAAERTAKLVEKHLNAVAREKRRRHPPSDQPFRPFLLSLGGMMETDARDPLKLWKSIISGGGEGCIACLSGLRSSTVL
jgi:hypothetical protein